MRLCVRLPEVVICNTCQALLVLNPNMSAALRHHRAMFVYLVLCLVWYQRRETLVLLSEQIIQNSTSFGILSYGCNVWVVHIRILHVFKVTLALSAVLRSQIYSPGCCFQSPWERMSAKCQCKLISVPLLLSVTWYEVLLGAQVEQQAVKCQSFSIRDVELYRQIPTTVF